MMLTKRQLELLLFINKSMKENIIAPSFEEMMQGMGLKSKAGIHRMLVALEERQFIRRLPSRARAIEIIRLPGINMKPGMILT